MKGLRGKIESWTPEWSEYELLDSGNRRKLERFGKYVLDRPEPQAEWLPARPGTIWKNADGQFSAEGNSGKNVWRFSECVPQRWEMRRGKLAFWVAPTPAGHVGVFPDQASHWDWLTKTIEGRGKAPRVLALFGYTGLATLACAGAGAHVTHVDASRKAVAWARENQLLSKLGERPVRWIVDDASAFVAREIRRGQSYDAMILDPPRFGRGPKGQLWKVEEALRELLQQCRKLLSAKPRFVLLNAYTTVLTRRQSDKEAERLAGYVEEMIGNRQAAITTGELFVADSAGRRISHSVFARACIE
ncbi:MAG TPA: class I SAM-dependent methyltransferase [Candidatus Acidoferrum sp.]|nr:class I SAM-dependent methyltransferase [Candidatus Acidoferrum sp.]